MKEIHGALKEFKKEFPAVYEGHEGLGTFERDVRAERAWPRKELRRRV